MQYIIKTLLLHVVKVAVDLNLCSLAISVIVHIQLLFCVVKEPAVPTSATASASAIPSTLSSVAARRRQPAPARHCALSPARIALWSGEVMETVCL